MNYMDENSFSRFSFSSLESLWLGKSCRDLDTREKDSWKSPDRNANRANNNNEHKHNIKTNKENKRNKHVVYEETISW